MKAASERTRLIEEALRQPFWRVRLPGSLEASYGRDGYPALLDHMLRSGWFSVGAVNLFLIVDWLMANDVFLHALVLRLFVLSPLVVLLLMVARQGMAMLRPKAASFMLGLLAVLISWGAALVLYLILQKTQSEWGVYYYAGFMVVIVYGNLVHQNLRFAGLFTLGILLMAVVGMHGDPDYPPALRVSLINLLASTAVFTLMASHVAERARRRRYLLMLRDRQLVEELEGLNQQLHQASRRDALTGLTNRRGLHEALDACWARGRHTRRPVALLMMDVDHFKRYNDRYGHPAGDQCLQRVARTLAEVLSNQPGALVARFGGEEFVAVLPDVDGQRARQVAEQVRTAVESLGLPHADGLPQGVVTLSIGVASLHVRRDEAPDKLMSGADRALYDAKRQGRNQVVVYQASGRSEDR